MEKSRSLPNNPQNWSYEDVAYWFKTIKMGKYSDIMAHQHKIDGQCLLSLTENDLKSPPVSMKCLGDVKKIMFAIDSLNDEVFESDSSSSTSKTKKSLGKDEHILVEYNQQNRMSISGEDILTTTRRSEVVNDEQSLIETLAKSSDGMTTIQLISRDELIRRIEMPDTFSYSIIKLSMAFVYSLASFLITAVVMVYVHDRVPDTKLYPPLPDIVLDNVPTMEWAFYCCEAIGLFLSLVWVTVIILHKEKVVIARRMFSLLGTIFLLRCFTMVITSLSVPGVHLKCEARPNTSLTEKFYLAFHIWKNMGMSLHGVRSCGDYMFSGHTSVITMISHFITEYTPHDWHYLHAITWVLNAFAIFFILAAHEHYSIDVFIAFYISSRMFMYYHAYAYNHANMTSNDNRMRFWFPLGWFFEYGSTGKVKNEYSLPFPIRIPTRFWNSSSSSSAQPVSVSAQPQQKNGSPKRADKKQGSRKHKPRSATKKRR